MISIAALTDYNSDDSEDEPLVESTKEAQESEAFALYNQALHQQRVGNSNAAERIYKQLLNSNFVAQVEVPEQDHEPLVDPAAILKYSAYKNLGNLALQKNEKKVAMEFFLEAVGLDSTDVTLWYRVGEVAIQLLQLSLARLSFQEGLRCNPKHWPCLDSIITILYAITDYTTCLFFIAKAFQRDPKYLKGHAFKQQIFNEDHTLKRDAYKIFKNCSDSVHNFRMKKEVMSKYVDEAVHLREERRKLAVDPSLPVLKFLTPLKEFRWVTLGERLIELYSYVHNSNPKISYGCKVDLVCCLIPQEEDPADKAGAKQVHYISSDGNKSASSSDEKAEKKVTINDPAETKGQEYPDSQSELEDYPEEQYGGGDALSARMMGGPCDNQSATTDYSGKEIDESQMPEKARKSHKRKRGFANEPAPGKRRSARVRNTEKKKEEHEAINYHALLQGFLPSTLLERNLTEAMDISDSADPLSQKPVIGSSIAPSDEATIVIQDLQDTEENDVKEFLKKNERNGGVPLLLRKYLICLAKKVDRKWPRRLCTLYIDAYTIVREHMLLPMLSCPDSGFEHKRGLGVMLLMYAEQRVDRWQQTRDKQETNELAERQLQKELVFMEGLTVREHILKEWYPDFAIRVFWMKARQFLNEGRSSDAVLAYDRCMSHFPQIEAEKHRIVLPNLQGDQIITKENIEAKIVAIRRTQSHEEIVKLFEEEKYDKVVEILLPMLDAPMHDGKDDDAGEQFEQKLMLFEALTKIRNYQKLFGSGCKVLKGVWEELSVADMMKTKKVCMEKINKLNQLMLGSLKESIKCLVDVHPAVLSELTHILIDIVAWTMENIETHLELPPQPTPSVVHWAVLYYIIKFEEDKLQSKQISQTEERGIKDRDERSRSESPAPLLPSSIMLLDTAHEYLGRKSWCCSSKGALLKLFVQVLTEELEKGTEDNPHHFLDDLQQSLEQCFYCLYGHPNKRTKAKHLQDHGVEEVPLTWEDSKAIFEYFKPKLLPEFDGYKTSSMSGDLENLFLRITKVIPLGLKPEGGFDKIQSYVEGTSEEVPSLAADLVPDCPVVTEIFYLLADYYFKNKEFGKATKFYMHDICVCPNRLDSWAGMALARSGRLELKLNSCDSKTDSGVYKQGMNALKCFHRALEVDPTNIKIWIEYGSFAYILQSHASRQLKQQEQLELSDESISGLKTKREEMRTLANECFLKANEVGGEDEEEEWVVHYMLGKIAEKRKDAKTALQHYLTAMKHLHDDGAKFPKKISYHNPPDLALESLEMYFRIHALVLKLLEVNGPSGQCMDLAMFDGLLKEANQQAFVLRQEKKLIEISSEHSTDTEQDSKFLSVPPPSAHSRSNSPRFFMTPQDHDYVRRMKRRSRASSREDHPMDTASESDMQSGDESGVVMETPNTDQRSQNTSNAVKADEFILEKLAAEKEVKAKPEVAQSTEVKKDEEEVKGQGLATKGDGHDGDVSRSLGNKVKDGVNDKETVEKLLHSSENLKCATEDVISREEINEQLSGKKENAVNPEVKVDICSLEGEESRIGGKEDGEVLYTKLVRSCINAMHLCLQRFPQHYKALYRIAHWYLHSKTHQNYKWCRDLLLGSVLPWQQAVHMPAPALFGEHSKTKNIFQGIWRIPIADLDRSGSFAWHMYRSVMLLIDVLEKLKDHGMLNQLASKLSKTPEQGKKFLRDSDRLPLARTAYQTCQRVFSSMSENLPAMLPDRKLKLLLGIHYTTSMGQQLHLQNEGDITDSLLIKLYTSLKGEQTGDEATILDRVNRYCHAMSSIYKYPQQMPTQVDTVKGSKTSSAFGPTNFDMSKSGKFNILQSPPHAESSRSCKSDILYSPDRSFGSPGRTGWMLERATMISPERFFSKTIDGVVTRKPPESPARNASQGLASGESSKEISRLGQIQSRPLQKQPLSIQRQSASMQEPPRSFQQLARSLQQPARPLHQPSRPLNQLARPLQQPAKPLPQLTRPLPQLTRPRHQPARPLPQPTKTEIKGKEIELTAMLHKIIESNLASVSPPLSPPVLSPPPSLSLSEMPPSNTRDLKIVLSPTSSGSSKSLSPTFTVGGPFDPAQNPDLGAHLSSLLQQVRTGFTIGSKLSKSRIRKHLSGSLNETDSVIKRQRLHSNEGLDSRDKIAPLELAASLEASHQRSDRGEGSSLGALPFSSGLAAVQRKVDDEEKEGVLRRDIGHLKSGFMQQNQSSNNSDQGSVLKSKFGPKFSDMKIGASPNQSLSHAGILKQTAHKGQEVSHNREPIRKGFPSKVGQVHTVMKAKVKTSDSNSAVSFSQTVEGGPKTVSTYNKPSNPALRPSKSAVFKLLRSAQSDGREVGGCNLSPDQGSQLKKSQLNERTVTGGFINPSTKSQRTAPIVGGSPFLGGASHSKLGSFPNTPKRDMVGPAKKLGHQSKSFSELLESLRRNSKQKLTSGERQKLQQQSSEKKQTAFSQFLKSFPQGPDPSSSNDEKEGV